MPRSHSRTNSRSWRALPILEKERYIIFPCKVYLWGLLNMVNIWYYLNNTEFMKGDRARFRWIPALVQQVHQWNWTLRSLGQDWQITRGRGKFLKRLLIYHLIAIIYYLADLSLQNLTEKNAGLILLWVLPLPTSVLEGGIAGGWKIVIFRSSILNLGLLNRKLYVDFKIGLNLKNPITNKSVQCTPLFFSFFGRHLVYYTF